MNEPLAAKTMAHELRAVYTLWLRDMTRFVTEWSRLIGALAQPLIFLLIFGTGLGSTFRGGALLPQGFSYTQFMFPGILGMTVLFTSLFSSISVIWDREFGFLKEILVAPVSQSSIVLGKMLGGATQALIQGTILLILMPFLGLWPGILGVLKLWLIMFLIAITLTGLGLALASRMSSMEGFQMIMNFIVMPLWMLSGAFFPLQGVPGWMEFLMKIDPLTYAVDALRGVMYEGSPMAKILVAHSFSFDLTVVAALALLAFMLALLLFRRGEG